MLLLEFRIEFCLQAFVLVAIVGCQFEVLILNSLQFLLPDLTYLFLQLRHIRLRIGVCRSQMQACSDFVHCVNGLIWERAVSNIALCQFDTRCQRLVRICHLMVVLIALLDVREYLHSLLRRCLLHDNLLEATLKGTVFLYRLAIFIQRRSTDTLYCAARQSRLQHICCIHAA